jgi:RimJ/RimL family protein N-acetyltransferase
VLETPRLVLKPLALEDAEAVQALFPHWEIVRYLNRLVPWPYPPDGALTFFRDIALPAIARGDEWIWTLRLKTDPAQIIGSIGLKRSDDENRGFWLGLPWHGRGLMTEAADAVTHFWFEQLQFPVLRVPKAVANKASRRISEKQGMRVIAVVERDYVSGRGTAEIWEITAAEWRLRRARSLLAAYFEPTPLVRAESLSKAGRDVYLKNETLLPTGSFKVRGAIYALSANLARGPLREVIAAAPATTALPSRTPRSVSVFKRRSFFPPTRTRSRRHAFANSVPPLSKGAPISPRPSTPPTNMQGAPARSLCTMPPIPTFRSARPRSARS